jgi:CRISPR-associated protein Cmr1
MYDREKMLATTGNPPERKEEAADMQSGNHGSGRHAELEQKLAKLRGRSAGDGSTHGVDELRKAALQAHRQRWTTLFDLELETVTPVYGGGSHAGRPDLLVPFRPRAIKNAIRHWWWLLNRHRPEYLGQSGAKRLHEDLLAIWGGVDTAGLGKPARVRVSVELKDPDLVLRHCFTYLPYQERSGIARQKFDDPWLYALFGAKGRLSPDVRWDRLMAASHPLRQPNQTLRRLNEGSQSVFSEPPADLLAPGLGFRLIVECDDSAAVQAVRSSVRAWLAFGGVGARTSRGLGRLRIAGVQGEGGSKADMLASLPAIEEQLGIGNNTWRSTQPMTPMASWEFALENYRAFRQLRLPTRLRPAGARSPGRSCWPKSDVVRSLTREKHDERGVRHGIIHKAVPSGEQRLDADVIWPVPEIYFGAPIIVQYAAGAGDPHNVQILPARSHGAPLERFASCVLTLPWHDYSSGEWYARIVALPYRQDLTDIGVLIKNESKERPNRFHYLRTQDGQAAFIEPGSWWPLSDESPETVSRAIWNGTPYQGVDGFDEVESFVAAGDVDPIKTLFNYLNKRRGLP